MAFPIVSDRDDAFDGVNGGGTFGFMLSSLFPRFVGNPQVDEFVWESGILHSSAFFQANVVADL